MQPYYVLLILQHISIEFTNVSLSCPDNILRQRTFEFITRSSRIHHVALLIDLEQEQFDLCYIPYERQIFQTLSIYSRDEFCGR